MIFGAVVALVELSWGPENWNFSWAVWHQSHQSYISMDLSCLWKMELLVKPAAFDLPIWMFFLLEPSHFNESFSYEYHCFGGDEEACKFILHS